MGIQKAIAALITSVIGILAIWGITLDWATPDFITSLAMVLTPVVNVVGVWVVSNKGGGTALSGGKYFGLFMALLLGVSLVSCAGMKFSQQIASAKSALSAAYKVSATVTRAKKSDGTALLADADVLCINTVLATAENELKLVEARHSDTTTTVTPLEEQILSRILQVSTALESYMRARQAGSTSSCDINRYIQLLKGVNALWTPSHYLQSAMLSRVPA